MFNFVENLVNILTTTYNIGSKVNKVIHSVEIYYFLIDGKVDISTFLGIPIIEFNMELKDKSKIGGRYFGNLEKWGTI
jgi:hypothetical protein